MVQTSIVWQFMVRFWWGFQRFFSESIALSGTLHIVLIYIARWRHNFREIAVKNCEKSKHRRKRLCAPLRIDSWEIWRKLHRRAGSLCAPKVLSDVNFLKYFEHFVYSMECCCAPVLRFSLWRQMAPQQIAKFRTTFFGQFRTSLKKDIVANYASIWKLFFDICYGTRCALQRTEHFAYPSIGGVTRFAKLR